MNDSRILLVTQRRRDKNVFVCLRLGLKASTDLLFLLRSPPLFRGELVTAATIFGLFCGMPLKPIGFVDPDVKEDPLFVRFLMTFMKSICRLRAEQIVVRKFCFTMEPPGYSELVGAKDMHMTGLCALIGDDSAAAVETPLNPPQPEGEHVVRMEPVDKAFFCEGEFELMVGYFQLLAHKMHTSLSAHRVATGAFPELSGVLCGAVKRSAGELQTRGQGFFAAITVRSSALGSMALLFSWNRVPHLVLFDGRDDVVEANYPAILLGFSFIFDFSRACLCCKTVLSKAQTRHCARCGGVYCSRKCQTEHWPVHRSDCIG